METEDGKIKVLDFGLAKAFVEDGPEADSSMSPTLTRDATRIGVILGTAAYMSPEQAKGKRVDKRADVWAFGVVLYEMLTGTRPFVGEDVSDTLAAVLRGEPAWEALPSDLAPTFGSYLRRCLEKDSKRRVRDIGDVRLAMDGAFDSVPRPHDIVSKANGWQRSRASAFALAFGVLTGVTVWGIMRSAPTPRPLARFSLAWPPDVSLTGGGRHVVALSPDGTRIAYSANEQIYLRTLDQTEATPIRGTEGSARGPFFSPDGEWVGFYSGGQLKKVAIRGGAPVSLCDALNPWGARWGADNTIVFGQPENIMHVSADGGPCEVLVTVEAGEITQGPQILPGQKAVLFSLNKLGTSWDDAQIVVQSLDTGERKVLIEGGREARYVPAGHLIYVSDGTLLAVPFEVDALEVTGGPVSLVEGVMNAVRVSGAAQFSVSDTGSLVYVVGSGSDTERTLVWVDRDGNEEALAAEPHVYRYPRISPDGGRVALDVADQKLDIWIWDFARETLTRLTFDPAREDYPAWTPDGQRVAFSSLREGPRKMYWKAADGTGAVERLTESENAQVPYAFSPDGQLVFRESGADQNADLGVLTLDGATEPLLATEFDERNAEISPNGRWLAYESNISGQSEIYVRPFPNVEDGQWLISKSGGQRPLWAPDGRELFYLVPGTKLMAVEVQTEPSFAAGNAKVVFEGPYSEGPFGRTYDISPDGKRFLMIKERASEETSSPELILVLNWFQELKRLVPTDR
ncbi:MAG: hypothetical protein BMS9Abin37_2232 [Acidobacteriota bacterium]|nr:MAG: hypothetical protein BMS9Abin37_2232 [Acidobacteriota bacterium]